MKKCKLFKPFVLAFVLAMQSLPAFAVGQGGVGFVWDGILIALASNFVGVVAFVVGTLAIVAAALAWAFGDSQQAGKRIGQSIVGVAIAVGAALLVNQIAASVGAVI